MRMHTTGLLTSDQAASKLGIARTTLNRRVRNGQIPTVGRLPGKTGAWLFDPAEIKEIAKDKK